MVLTHQFRDYAQNDRHMHNIKANSNTQTFLLGARPTSYVGYAQTYVSSVQHELRKRDHVK